jgi:hypothetical protein
MVRDFASVVRPTELGTMLRKETFDTLEAAMQFALQTFKSQEVARESAQSFFGAAAAVKAFGPNTPHVVSLEYIYSFSLFFLCIGD